MKVHIEYDDFGEYMEILEDSDSMENQKKETDVISFFDHLRDVISCKEKRGTNCRQALSEGPVFRMGRSAAGTLLRF